MRKLILAFAFCLLASPVWAQCNGVFTAGSVCGAVVTGPPGQHPIGSFPTSAVTPSGVITPGDVPYWVTTATQGDTGYTSSAVALLTRPNQVINGGGAIAVTAVNTTPTSGSVFTPNCGLGPIQRLTNNASFYLVPPTADSFCDFQLTNSTSAGTVVISGYTVNPNFIGGALDTTPGHLFFVHLERINGSSIYTIIPQQ